MRAADTALWTSLLRDPNPIHVDAAAVRQLGLGDRPINQGPANLAYIFNMLAANFPAGHVRALEARMTGLVHVGDTVEVSGHVITTSANARGRSVRCALELRVCGDDHLLAATAIADVELSDRV